MKVELQQASAEQQIITDHVSNGFNVCTRATAGSGKSTSIIYLANKLQGKKILQITYNSMLRKEFKDKICCMKINNIDVHTYHSLGVKYFSSKAYTDSGLRQILHSSMEIIESIPKYDIVVIDECQDMSPLYFQFVEYFLYKVNSKIQLVILGDELQGIYEFKGSDIRFLTMAEELWKEKSFLKTNIFYHCKLKMSYRVTNQMAQFINTSMLGCGDDNKVLYACRDGAPVQYIRNSTFHIERVVVNIIQRILDEGDLPSDIFILASSVKGNTSNVRKIENALSHRGFPCYIPNIETEKLDERVVDGKIVFSTFHTVKGRQRKYVFVVGFDESYMKYNARNLSKDICPNPLFVACTRATHTLFLLESNNNSTDKPLKFLRLSHHDMKKIDYVDFKGNAQSIFYDENPATVTKENRIPTYKITPTELIKFIPEYLVDIITPLISEIFVESQISDDTLIDDERIPSIIKFSSGMYEDVSDLNGIAIPCLYFDYMNNSTGEVMTLYRLIKEIVLTMKDNEHQYLKEIFEQLVPVCVTTADYLYMSNVYIAMKEKLYFRLKQINKKEYDWLSDDTIDECKKLLDKHILSDTDNPNDISQEVTIIENNMITEQELIDNALRCYMGKDIPEAKYCFAARVDMITKRTIWEIKCTSQISIEYLLQVVIYAWLWYTLHPRSDKDFRILNIKTGEVLKLVSSVQKLTRIVVLLLKGKYDTPKILNDKDFRSCFTNMP
jgi:AAA domain